MALPSRETLSLKTPLFWGIPSRKIKCRMGVVPISPGLLGLQGTAVNQGCAPFQGVTSKSILAATYSEQYALHAEKLPGTNEATIKPPPISICTANLHHPLLQPMTEWSATVIFIFSTICFPGSFLHPCVGLGAGWMVQKALPALTQLIALGSLHYKIFPIVLIMIALTTAISLNNFPSQRCL